MNHTTASNAELLAAVQERDALALVELYQRTGRMAHGVLRRLVTDAARLEDLLTAVYREIWMSPPAPDQLASWLRARCFELGVADLRERGATAASWSAAWLLSGAPPAAGDYYMAPVEKAIAGMPAAERMTLLLAHDQGLPTSDHVAPDAGEQLTRALLRLSNPPVDVPTEVDARLGAWVLGLLPDAEAADLAAAVSADEDLAVFADGVRRGARRLEGLAPISLTGHRVLARVLAPPDHPSASDTAALHATIADDVEDDDAAHPVARRQPQRKAVPALAAAAVLFILAANLLSFGMPSGPSDADLAVAATRQPVAAATQRPVPAAARPPVDRPKREKPPTPRSQVRRPKTIAATALPLSLKIPKMGVDRRLVGLDVQQDGTLATPVDYADPGWFQDGVAPGAPGAAVIAGHVDSLTGPAIFYDLQKLRRGDKVHVERTDGTTATFIVDRVERYPKENFPTALVYGDTARSELRLITCGGAFNETTRHYDDNVIAFAHLVNKPPAQPEKKTNDKHRKEADGKVSKDREKSRDGGDDGPDASNKKERQKDQARRRDDGADVAGLQ